MYKIETHCGIVRISKAVIGDVIKDALADFHKSVYLVNRKGAGMGSFGWPYRPGAGNLIEVSAKERIHITVYVIIRFGVSIEAMTEKMSAAMRGALADKLELEPDSLIIHILGVKSKDIAKRNIMIKA